MLYDYIWIFFYQVGEKMRSNESRFFAGGFTTIAIFFHTFFVLAILQRFTVRLETIIGPQPSKYVFLPFVLFSMWILERIFKKRADGIIQRYEGRNTATLANGFLIVFIIFVPLIVAAILSKK